MCFVSELENAIESIEGCGNALIHVITQQTELQAEAPGLYPSWAPPEATRNEAAEAGAS